MVPGKYNMICPQGATFSQSMTVYLNDAYLDFTNYTARMQVRETHASDDFIAELTTENFNIVLDPAFGRITLTLDAATTTAFTPGEYVYDLEIINGSTVDRIVEGKFIITPEVTR